MFQCYSADFYNRPPERKKSVHTHTDIEALCICSHRSTSLVQRVVKGGWYWAAPELLPFMIGAGMSSWGSPEAKENILSSSRMEKQARQNYCGNKYINQEWSWLKGAPERCKFSLVLLPFPLPIFFPFKPLFFCHLHNLSCVLLTLWPWLCCPNTLFFGV